MTATLLTDATLATCAGDGARPLREHGAVLVEDGRIAWVADAGAIPRTPAHTQRVDCGGRLLTPGLIDCHTHLVHAGSRAGEFAQRQQGASYAEIAAAGGGIAGTVKATRAATAQELREQSLPRLEALMSEGVTSVEIKSGYGLDVDTECRMLRVARQLGKTCGLRVSTTFLGAHALPPEFAGRADDYIDHVCRHMLPAVHEAGLADAVDVFIESIAFTPAQARRVFETAARLGLPVKAHAEQLAASGGTALALEFAALSVDHLEYLAPAEVAQLAASGAVAVMLPGAFHFLREHQLPPIDALRAHAVPMAVATDANPGTSPVYSLLTAMSLACTLFGLTPTEALRGVTVNAARALGIADQVGSLQPGRIADLVLWDADDPAQLCFQLGLNPCRAVMQGGIWRGDPAAVVGHR